jgi:hypothetical protein
MRSGCGGDGFQEGGEPIAAGGLMHFGTLALWRFGGPLLVLIAASSVHNVKEKSVASSAFCLRQVPELGWARLLGARARALEVGPFDGA